MTIAASGPLPCWRRSSPPRRSQPAQRPTAQASGLNLRGDLALAMFVVGELRRSYSELPVRWLCDVVLAQRTRTGPGAAPPRSPGQASASLGLRPGIRPL